MAFYKDVSERDPFQPSASLSNDVRHLLNSFGNVGTPKGSFTVFPKTLAVDCYNASTATIASGIAVKISADNDNRLFGVPFTAGSVKYGVATGAIERDDSGRVATAGVVFCAVTGTAGTHTHIKPTDGGRFEFADDGIPLIRDNGDGTAMAFLQAQSSNGGLSVGTSLEKALDIAGGAIEAEFIADTTTPVMATAVFGASTRTAGDTLPHRPTVSQREFAVKSPASNGIFITPYFSADTATAVGLESELPPQQYGTATAFMPFIDGAKFASNSVSVQRFGRFDASTSAKVGLPYVSYTGGAFSLDFASGGGNAGYPVYDNNNGQMTFANAGTNAIVATWHGTPKAYETYDAESYGAQIPYWNGTDWDYLTAGNGESGDCLLTTSNGGFYENPLGFTDTTDDADHIVIKRKDGSIYSRVWHPAEGRCAVLYWDSYGDLSVQELGADDVDQLLVIGRGGAPKQVTGGSSSGRYKLQLNGGVIRWATDN